MEESSKTSIPRESLDGFMTRVYNNAVQDGLSNATKKDASTYARAALKALTDIIADCKYFSVPNGFSLTPVYYESRIGHNPQKPGETVEIPAQWKTKLKLSPALKRRMSHEEVLS